MYKSNAQTLHNFPFLGCIIMKWCMFTRVVQFVCRPKLFKKCANVTLLVQSAAEKKMTLNNSMLVKAK